MLTKMNTRLQQFLSAENISQAQFADSINVARAGVSHIIAGRNKPGYDFIVNTMKRYPNLSIEWLLSGKGKMYKTPVAREDPTIFPSEVSPAASRDPIEAAPEITLPGPTEMPEKSDEARVQVDSAPNIEISEGSEGASQPTQLSVRQRKATKIIVFYDDGTFQEF